MSIRDGLEQLGLPPTDLYELPTSEKRFPDGAHYRIEIPSTEGPRCQSVRQFAENLLEFLDLPTAFWDERLSTAAVERFLIEEADMTRKRRAQVIDRAAAAYILQGALDLVGTPAR